MLSAAQSLKAVEENRNRRPQDLWGAWYLLGHSTSCSGNISRRGILFCRIASSRYFKGITLLHSSKTEEDAPGLIVSQAYWCNTVQVTFLGLQVCLQATATQYKEPEVICNECGLPKRQLSLQNQEQGVLRGTYDCAKTEFDTFVLNSLEGVLLLNVHL